MSKKVIVRETPLTLADLKPCPWNPRYISEQAASGLRASIKNFGDISGIVYNKRTGHLVCGHQRLDQLKALHGDALKMEGEAIVTPSGERFSVRVVDWDDATERAANVAANSPVLQGTFSQEQLEEILAEVKEEIPEIYEEVLLDLLLPQKIDYEQEWKGMPEATSEDQTAFKRIIVNFSDENGIKEFSKAIGQTVGMYTRSIWFPQVEIRKCMDKEYRDES